MFAAHAICGAQGLHLLPEIGHTCNCFAHCQKAKACQLLLCLLVAAGLFCCQGPSLCCQRLGMPSLNCSQSRRCMLVCPKELCC